MLEVKKNKFLIDNCTLICILSGFFKNDWYLSLKAIKYIPKQIKISINGYFGKLGLFFHKNKRNPEKSGFLLFIN
ncbi:MAG: hypothetical protein JL50_06655 [Peptococcaceae bacterium BICA1-7]|nr:MAG: hypothetical protein JL50_06655 [Peptococcaceae bacterium BICA1-7]HBV99251.1 hypothetical protein [Desulfotomaculum sp.]